jgi:O-acetyl-ADP-ribose deacetylase (regulator of RNase III)
MEHPMIVYKSDNLLQADVEALVNTVNTVGVMGKGIALQFKQLLMCPVIKLNIEFREEK